MHHTHPVWSQLRLEQDLEQVALPNQSYCETELSRQQMPSRVCQLLSQREAVAQREACNELHLQDQRGRPTVLAMNPPRSPLYEAGVDCTAYGNICIVYT